MFKINGFIEVTSIHFFRRESPMRTGFRFKFLSVLMLGTLALAACSTASEEQP